MRRSLIAAVLVASCATLDDGLPTEMREDVAICRALSRDLCSSMHDTACPGMVSRRCMTAMGWEWAGGRWTNVRQELRCAVPR